MPVATIDAMPVRPDPEVRPPRRSYSPKYKLEVLSEIDASETKGGVGEILRREGLYSSLVSEWRKQRDRGALEAMSGRKPGRKGADPLVAENARLRERVGELEEQLDTAKELIQAQGKVSALLQKMSRKSARHRRQKREGRLHSAPPPQPRPRRPHPAALTDEEKERIVGVLCSERCFDLARAQVYTTLLDEGTYLCSERQMYRFMEERGLVRERRRGGHGRAGAYGVTRLEASGLLISSVDVDAAHIPTRAQVVMVVTASEITADEGAIEVGSGFCSTEVARRLMCDSDIEVVICNKDGRPEIIGANTRAVPKRLSRLIRARDKTCVFPGCGESRNLQIHHIIPASRAGPTTEVNLACICYFHHHLVHEGGWSMTGSAPEGLVIKSPFGKRYRTGPLRMRLAQAS